MLVIFVHRSANKITHLLAQPSYSVSRLQDWHDNVPDFIACNLALDEMV